MIPHRYFLHAVPYSDDDSNKALAAAFNKKPDGFLFQRSAQRQAIFYTHQLGLPLKFTILHRDDRPR